jgi:hypothetical protein
MPNSMLPAGYRTVISSVDLRADWVPQLPGTGEASYFEAASSPSLGSLIDAAC